MFENGTVVGGRYKILGELGRGGMSVVYLAVNERANKTWAVKAIRKSDMEEDDWQRRGLLAEIHLLKNLHHRYFPDIVDVLEDENCLLVVMEYIQGRTLKEMLEESMEKHGRPLPVEEVIVWARQLCEVLNYLHTRPEVIIYRDMKPANVMIRPSGEVMLIDFGTAWVCRKESEGETICLGTPGFAAPEQYGEHGRIGPWTDIYSLGATLHCLLTGREPSEAPFYFPDILECCTQLTQQTADESRPMLRELAWIIQKCTRYSIDERYQSCEELGRALGHPAETGAELCKFTARRGVLFWISIAVSLIAGVLLMYGFYVRQPMQQNGYDYYMGRGETADYREKIECYRKAISSNPSRQEAYLALLETMLVDNCLSADEIQLMTEVLYTKEKGRAVDNRTCLRENRSGYVVFAYQMGIACYYFSGEEGGKGRAEGWLKIVADADPAVLDLGEYEDMKEAWQARAVILERLSVYDTYKIDRMNYMGEAVSYREYWKDLMALMAEKLADKDNIVTELGLYQEIVMAIFDRTADFKEEAGLLRSELEGVLDEIEFRLEQIDPGNRQRIQELKENIEQTMGKARRNISAVYAEKQENN